MIMYGQMFVFDESATSVGTSGMGVSVGVGPPAGGFVCGGVIGAIVFLFYYYGSRPDNIKSHCREQAYSKLRGRESATPDLMKDTKQKNWLLNIYYRNCMANKGIYEQWR